MSLYNHETLSTYPQVFAVISCSYDGDVFETIFSLPFYVSLFFCVLQFFYVSPCFSPFWLITITQGDQESPRIILFTYPFILYFVGFEDFADFYRDFVDLVVDSAVVFPDFVGFAG